MFVSCLLFVGAIIFETYGERVANPRLRSCRETVKQIQDCPQLSRREREGVIALSPHAGGREIYRKLKIPPWLREPLACLQTRAHRVLTTRGHVSKRCPRRARDGPVPTAGCSVTDLAHAHALEAAATGSGHEHMERRGRAQASSRRPRRDPRKPAAGVIEVSRSALKPKLSIGERTSP